LLRQVMRGHTASRLQTRGLSAEGAPKTVEGQAPSDPTDRFLSGLLLPANFDNQPLPGGESGPHGQSNIREHKPFRSANIREHKPFRQGIGLANIREHKPF
ncbi:MAG: hypothetical protein ACRDTR_12505, partial [Rubrobacter sp.]